MNDIVVDLAILRNAVFRTNTSKLVWFCLARDMGDDNTVTTSALAISKEIGVSEKAVRNVIKSLSENGLIECVNVTQSPNKSPNESPKKVRYIGRTIRLNGIACYNGSKNRQVRKKSESKSELKSESITPTVTTKISSDTLAFEPYVDPRFYEPWRLWLEYRREIKNMYKTPKSERIGYEQFIKKSNNDPTQALEIVRNSIANGYKGLFPEKGNGRISTTQPSVFTQREEERSDVAFAAGAMLRAIGREQYDTNS